MGFPFVDIYMDSVMVQRLGGRLTFARPLEPDLGIVNVRTDSFEAVYNDHYRDVWSTRHPHDAWPRRRRGDRGGDLRPGIRCLALRSRTRRSSAAVAPGHRPPDRHRPLAPTAHHRLAALAREHATGSGHLGWQTSDATEPGGPDHAAGAAEFWLWLDALSKALPTRQRDVILLRYQRDLTDEDIGEILGLSASGVRTLASRALGALRKHPELWS